MFVWDETKRISNLSKHGLDFADAHLVYDDPDKSTYLSRRKSEDRWLDLAIAQVHGRMLALIYTRRGKDIRIISFDRPHVRSASNMKKTESKTDWAQVLAHKETDPLPYDKEDGPYHPNDAEAARIWLAQADLVRGGKVVGRGKRGPQKLPTKKLVSLRLSPEVIAHFKASGPGWQTRIDDTLLEAIKRAS